mgnify:CR=1 FL=1
MIHKTGTIPSELGLLTLCSSLGVAHNLLTGTIPNEVAAISPMEPNQQGEYMGQYIRYNDNQLTGTLAPDFFRNNQSLMLHASFENNQFSGSLPSEIGYWTGLSYFTIHNNILTGPIPSEIGTFQSLGTLSLGANNWSGTFHSELGLLVTNGTINTFNISRSQTLTGTLPEEFCDWISDVSLDRVLAFDCGPVCDCDCNCSETNA